jgi:hypothetical protein
LIRPAIQAEDQVWGHISEFDEQVSKEKLQAKLLGMRSLSTHVRDLVGFETEGNDPLRIIYRDRPNIYDSYIRPMTSYLRRIHSNTSSENMKEDSFDRFKMHWDGLKQELGRRKPASVMRDYLDRLEGTPLPPKRREDLSGLDGAQHPGESVTIDLTMD